MDENMALWVGECEDTLRSDYNTTLHNVNFMLCDIGSLCCSLLADRLGIQRVDISPTGFGDPFLSIIHNFPASLSHIPQIPCWLPQKLSFLGRVKNFIFYGFSYLMYSVYLTGPYSNLWRKYVPNSQYNNLEELFHSTGLLLIPTDFAISKPRTLASHMKVIGPILPEPAKPLPSHIHKLISTGKYNDVVIVSFGTVISNFGENFVETLASALSAIPATVIWKHKGKMPRKVSENVNIFPWFPQNDILGHPATKLFITHGGLNSIYEASFHGVPMVLIPLFGDQFDNAISIENVGMGEKINIKETTAEKIIDKVHQVLNNDSYSTRAKQVASQIVYPGRKITTVSGETYTQPMMRTPTEQAADWFEYGMYNNAGLHLRSEADKLSIIQTHMVDVIVFLVVCLLVFLKVLCVLVRWAVRICWRSASDQRPKTE